MEGVHREKEDFDDSNLTNVNTPTKDSRTADQDGPAEEWMQDYCNALAAGKIKSPSSYSFKDKAWITEECKRFIYIKLFYRKRAHKLKTEHAYKLEKVAKDRCKSVLRRTKRAYQAEMESLKIKKKNSSDDFTMRQQSTSQAARDSSSDRSVDISEEYPTWYDSKCKEMSVLKDYYRNMLKINRNDSEAVSNYKETKKKLKRLERDARARADAKAKAKLALKQAKNIDTNSDRYNEEWQNSNIEQESKWQPMSWQNPQDKEEPLVDMEDSCDELGNRPLSDEEDEEYNKPKRTRYNSDDSADENWKNSSWKAFSVRESKKKKRSSQRSSDDLKTGGRCDYEAQSVVHENHNPEKKSYRPGLPDFQTTLPPPFQSQPPNSGQLAPPPAPEFNFSAPPGDQSFNNPNMYGSGGFCPQRATFGQFRNRAPSPNPNTMVSMFPNQQPPGFTQGPPRFNQRPPMLNQRPPVFNQGPPPRFDSRGSPGFNIRAPGFNNRVPPPNFNSQPPGFKNQRPPGLVNQGPPDFNNQNGPPNFNNQNGPPDFNNQRPPNFNSHGPPNFNSHGPRPYSAQGYCNQGPPPFRPQGSPQFNSQRLPFQNEAFNGNRNVKNASETDQRSSSQKSPEHEVEDFQNDYLGLPHHFPSSKGTTKRERESKKDSEEAKEFVPFPPPPLAVNRSSNSNAF